MNKEKQGCFIQKLLKCKGLSFLQKKEKEEISAVLQNGKEKITLDPESPRKLPVEEQKKVVDTWLDTNPKGEMPVVIELILLGSDKRDCFMNKLDNAYLLTVLEKLVDIGYPFSGLFFTKYNNNICNKFLYVYGMPTKLQEKIFVYFLKCSFDDNNRQDWEAPFKVFKFNQNHKYYQLKDYLLSPTTKISSSMLKVINTYIELINGGNKSPSQCQAMIDLIVEERQLLICPIFLDQRSSNLFSKFLEKGAKINPEQYKKIVNLCLDDVLHLSTEYIKVALRAVKSGNLGQEYYEKVMKAAKELKAISNE